MYRQSPRGKMLRTAVQFKVESGKFHRAIFW